MELFLTIWDYLGLPWIIWDYLKQSGTISDYLGISPTIWDYLGLSGTIWDYLGLSLTRVQVEEGESKLLLFETFFPLCFSFTDKIYRGARAPKNEDDPKM